MSTILLLVGQKALLGAIAAAGFGVLFNAGPRDLLWCAAGGALALAVRTACLSAGLSLEAATFLAATALTSATAGPLRHVLGTAASRLAVAGCIPMVPGAFFSQALLGLFALTAPSTTPVDPVALATTLVAMTRVILTVGAIGAGIAIPLTLLRPHEF
jgi:uncharacterized membrane protein YjjB (DUF3815 family)